MLLKVGLRVLPAVLMAEMFVGCSIQAKKARHLGRADHYYNAGEYEKAKIEYLNVLRLSLKNPRAIQRLGLIWMAEGLPLRAYPYLLEARNLDPADLEVRTKFAEVLSSLGEIAEARKEAKAILEKSAGSEEAIFVLADTAHTEDELSEVEEQLRRMPEQGEVAYHLGWAILANRTGDLAYARSELEEALKANPSSVRAHLMMAAAYSSQANLPEAEREYEMAVRLSTPGSQARLQYAQFLRNNGFPDKARAYLTETIKLAPHYQPARYLLAQIAFDEQKWDEALVLLDRILDTDFANIDATILLSEVRLAKGDTKQATERLEHLDAAYPNIPLIKYQLARAYVANNDFSQAIITLDQAIAAQPNYVDPLLLRAQLELRSGQANLVIPTMLGLLKQQPRLAAARSMLAEAYRVSGRLDDAVTTIRDQIRDAPQSPDGYFRLGTILTQQNKIDAAREAFEREMELAPDDLTGFDRLIDLDIAGNNFTAGLERIQRQRVKTPDSASVSFAEGKIYTAQRDWVHAEEALRRAVASDPNLSGAYELLVFGYTAAGKIPQAIQQLQSMLSKNQNDEGALMTLALIYDREKDSAKARDMYEKVVSLNPRLTAALNNLAYLYADVFNDPDKAYALARKAHEIEPSNPAFADTLGWALYRQGNYQQALNFIQESAGALSNSAEVQLHLGMASYMMDQLDKARTAFKKSVDAPGDLPAKEEASRWLAYLEDASDKQLSVNEVEAMVQHRPNDVIAQIRLGALYEKQGEFAKAAARYQAAISANSKLSDATLRLAHLYAGPLHDTAKALELAKTARELDPDSPRTGALLGKIACESGNFAWAYSLLEESARKLPKDSGLLHDLAWAAYGLGKTSEARSLMQRAIDANPSPELSADGKSFLAMTSAEPEGSGTESDIKSVLKANPDYLPALMAQACVQLRRAQRQAAGETYRKVLQRFPDFVPAERELASLYLDDGAKVNEAYDLASKAHNVVTEDPEVTRILGEVSYRRNDYRYALELLGQSEQTRPLDARGLYYLGMSHFRIGDQIESQRALQRALAAGLGEPLASEAKRVLASFQKQKS